MHYIGNKVLKAPQSNNFQLIRICGDFHPGDLIGAVILRALLQHETFMGSLCVASLQVTWPSIARATLRNPRNLANQKNEGISTLRSSEYQVVK